MNLILSVVTFLDAHEGSMLVLATIILVFVTGFYAWQTKLLSDLANRQRRENILPIIIAGRFTSHNEGEEIICVHSFLRNIGNGPAFNIRVKFFDDETKKLINPQSTFIDYLAKNTSGEKKMHIPKNSFETIRYKLDEEDGMTANLKVEIAFHDIFNKHHVIAQKFIFIKSSGEMRALLGSLYFDFAD